MERLTEKQLEVLQLIYNYSKEYSYPPTIQELAMDMGVKSKNAIVKHLDALQRKGYISKDSSTARGIRIIRTDILVEKEELKKNEIPLIGSVAAGLPIMAIENIEKHLTIPDDFIQANQVYYALRVQGESMIESGINDGDIVIVQQTNNARHNDIIVALIDEEATVKRIKKDGPIVYLKAENENYSDIYPKGDWTIQGRVVGLIREM